jgi:hypothetical protein
LVITEQERVMGIGVRHTLSNPTRRAMISPKSIYNLPKIHVHVHVHAFSSNSR